MFVLLRSIAPVYFIHVLVCQLSDGDKRLIRVIKSLEMAKIKHLNLSCNVAFWKHSQASEDLMDFISQQICLQSLDLKSNFFTADQTTQLLKHLTTSSSSDTIEDLNLMFTANFGTKESCELIAKLID